MPPPPQTDEEIGKKARPSFRGVGGYQYARIEGVPVTGGRVRLAAGAQNDNGGHYVSATALYGSTENGLRTWDLRVGYLGDLYRLSIVRLGLDLELGYLVVHRATTNTRLWAMGLGAGAHVGVDVFSWGTRNDHAIVIEGRFDGHIHFGGSFMWGPTVMAGFRY